MDKFINKVIMGDCLEKLKELPDNSVDSIVTDPPYELGFMGKTWDNTGIANNVEMWKECLRVLKPGGHLLAFSGTRTYHRMASAIEDAGFEVRDMIEWVYGSGFPKSHNVGLRLDQKLELQGFRGKETSFSAKVIQQKYVDGRDKVLENGKAVEKYEGKSEIAKQYQGWGTALKPAHEPICMARKPIQGTVAENCLKWGTGGINIDESRVGIETITVNRHSGYNSNSLVESTKGKWQGEQEQVIGRFPANFIHDNSEEVRECFPETKTGSIKPHKNAGSWKNCSDFIDAIFTGDSGNASRFFKSIIYQAKASKSERNKGCEELEEKHKGTDLMVRTLWTDKERNHLSKVLSLKINESNSICAEKYGFSPTLISFWKKGERIPTPETYEKLKTDYGLGDELDYIIYEHPKELTERTTILDNPAQLKSKNNHPTVKPIALMEYLIKMVTPKGGVVLDPFAGSGSTLVAAKQNGYQYIGIELTEEYIPIIEARLK